MSDDVPRLDSVVINPDDVILTIHVLRDGTTYIQAHPESDPQDIVRFLREVVERLA